MKKVVAFNGSPRADGNTADMINKVCSVLTEVPGVSCEIVHIGGKPVYGCRACGACKRNQDRKCTIQDDEMNSYIEKMIEADVIIIGSPTYYSTLTPEVKALIDRAGTVTRGNGNLLKYKIGAAVSPARRAGALNTFQTINNFFFISQMIIPGSSYWSMGVARERGEFEHDEEGIATMTTLGENIAWLLDRIQ